MLLEADHMAPYAFRGDVSEQHNQQLKPVRLPCFVNSHKGHVASSEPMISRAPNFPSYPPRLGYDPGSGQCRRKLLVEQAGQISYPTFLSHIVTHSILEQMNKRSNTDNTYVPALPAYTNNLIPSFTRSVRRIALLRIPSP